MQKIQKEINERMRIILLDWLVDVQLKFKLLPETLFLTINIIDRYLSKTKATKENLQLIGITSMLIACKYEEIYFPEIKDFIYMTDNTYSKDEVLKMEYDILKKLEFNITNPSSLKFLEIYNYYLKLDNKIYYLVKYFLELSLLNYKQIKYSPSIISTSAIYLAKKQEVLFVENELWNVSGYKFEDIEECYKDLKEYIFQLNKSKYLAVKRKFSSEKFYSVSKNFKIF
jgi:cyclin B